MNLKQKVEHCLKKYPKTRDSDIRLTNAVWIEFHGGKVQKVNGDWMIKLLDMYSVPKPDLIVRYRQKFNQEGLYLSEDPEVIKQRNIKEEKMYNEMSPNAGCSF